MMRAQKLRVLAPTSQARALIGKLDLNLFDLDIWQRPGSLIQEIQVSVEQGIPTLAVCALGIISRTLATCTLPPKAETAPFCVRVRMAHPSSPS